MELSAVLTREGAACPAGGVGSQRIEGAAIVGYARQETPAARITSELEGQRAYAFEGRKLNGRRAGDKQLDFVEMTPR